MYEQIRKTGITKIKKCSPSEANCIIRVYQSLKAETDHELFSNIYGAICYTKFKNVWETSDGITRVLFYVTKKFPKTMS